MERKYSLRKLSIGLASVALATTFLTTNNKVSAATTNQSNRMPAVEQKNNTTEETHLAAGGSVADRVTVESSNQMLTNNQSKVAPQSQPQQPQKDASQTVKPQVKTWTEDRTITRHVEINYPNNQKVIKNQSATFTRINIENGIKKETTDWTSSNDVLPKIELKNIGGYQPDHQIDSIKVTPDTKPIKEIVNYVPIQTSFNIDLIAPTSTPVQTKSEAKGIKQDLVYADPNGRVVARYPELIKGTENEKFMGSDLYKLYQQHLPEGWKLAASKEEITSQTISAVPDIVTVKKDNEQINRTAKTIISTSSKTTQRRKINNASVNSLMPIKKYQRENVKKDNGNIKNLASNTAKENELPQTGSAANVEASLSGLLLLSLAAVPWAISKREKN